MSYWIYITFSANSTVMGAKGFEKVDYKATGKR